LIDISLKVDVLIQNSSVWPRCY